MKSLLSLLATLFAFQCSYAQTNTFPSNGNVGIGTTSPIVALDVLGQGNITSNQTGVEPVLLSLKGTGSSPYLLQLGSNYTGGYGYIQAQQATITYNTPLAIQPNGGSVGIGTTIPESGFKFDVNGLGAIGTQASARIYMGTTDATHAFIQSRDNTVNQNLTFDAASYNFAIGNVGIGTATIPTGYKMAVNGNIIAAGVQILPNGSWPDYVFKPQYKLPSLSEVKTYIDQNQHLPDMPSEKEVAKEGINVGEMNKLLVKKVEELTLYLIEKDKEIDDIKTSNKREMDELKQSLETLTKEIRKNQ